jgi:hypothetical protein
MAVAETRLSRVIRIIGPAIYLAENRFRFGIAHQVANSVNQVCAIAENIALTTSANVLHAADGTAFHQAPHLSKNRRRAPLMIHDERCAVTTTSFDHSATLTHAGRHRFFAEDATGTSLRSLNCEWCVCRSCRGDNHHFGLDFAQHLAIIGVSTGAFMLRGEFLRECCVEVATSDNVKVGDAAALRA